MGKNKKTAPKTLAKAKTSPKPQGSPLQGRPTISLCMMVKNEEKRLPTALKSARPWVDEIIVVDTGSSDRTMEIAKEFGAKVYEHPWEFSFSTHRNQSISYATGDWLLILDADEELDQETAPQIRQLTQASPNIHGFLFEMYNVVAAGGESFILHPRLFRNRVGFHYGGKVHNRPIVFGAMAPSKVKLIHYGYNEDPETMRAKHERRLAMIRKWVEEEPDNYQPHSYLAHTLGSDRESQPLAVEEALTALRLAKEEPGLSAERLPHIYYPLLQSLSTLGRDDELIRYAHECLAAVPHYPDPWFFLVWVHYRQRRWQEVCDTAANFWAAQRRCRDNPQDFIFFENLTYDQSSNVFLRWTVAASHLGREQEAREAFLNLFDQREAEQNCKLTVQNLVSEGLYAVAASFAQLAAERHPDWRWTELLVRLSAEKAKENDAVKLREQGLAALAAGDGQRAATLLKGALGGFSLDAEAMLGLARALDESGQEDQALFWFIKGLNAHPGHAWAWRRLGELCFAQGNHAGALACYRRYLAQAGKDESVASRMAICERRLAQAGPSVAQAPPKLVVFLVGGLTHDMVRQPAPHLLMGTAWGALLHPEGELAGDLPNWATLFTAVEPARHGLTAEAQFNNPLGLKDLRTPSLWELLPPGCRVGLLAAPLALPPLDIPGWVVAGHPTGLLTPELVQPAELAPVALAANYRTDFLLGEFDSQTFAYRLGTDIRSEGALYQTERNKLGTAMALPAVDVLVIGLRALDYIQQVFELAHHNTFAAYQQVYGWIESTLAALRPENFAVLSQRGYAHGGNRADQGGFYCLSWLRGENSRARATDIAPEILKLMGGDLARLGQPR